MKLQIREKLESN